MIGPIVSKVLVRRGFARLCQGDIERFIAAFSEDVVFHYPGESIASGTFSGKARVRAWFARMIDHFPQRSFTLTNVSVRNLFDLVGNNIVSVEWQVRLQRGDGRVFDNRGITTIRLRFGKAVEVRDYIFDLATVRDAWSTASPELQPT